MPDNNLSITTSVGALSPADILAEENAQLLIAYAINAKADPEILTILAAHKNNSVRQAVAESPNTPAETLDHLAGVSYCEPMVAGNPNASAKTLTQILANEKRGETAYNNALANKNIPLEVIMQTLIEYMPTSSAIAVKSNERFSELMGVARQMDAEAAAAVVNETIFESDVDERWR